MPIGPAGALAGHYASGKVARSFRPASRKKGKEPKGLGGLLSSLLLSGGRKKADQRVVMNRGRPLVVPPRAPMMRNRAIHAYGGRPPLRRFVTPDGRPLNRQLRPTDRIVDPRTGMVFVPAAQAARDGAFRPPAQRGYPPPAAARRPAPAMRARTWRHPTRPEKRPSRLSRALKKEANIWLGTWSPYK